MKQQPDSITVIAAGRRVAGLAVADVGPYLKETTFAPPAEGPVRAEPFSLADDEAAVVEAETAASVHYPVQLEKHYMRNN